MATKTEFEIKIQEPLHCYTRKIFKPEINDPVDSIWLAIKYNDHGDDFWLIGTKNKVFHRYGYFIDRTCEFIRDEVWERKPMTYKEPDDRATASNAMYFAFREAFAERKFNQFFGRFDYYDYPIKMESKYVAEFVFDDFINKVKQTVNGNLMLHEHSGFGYNKESVRKFLIKNEIDTPENLKKLSDTPFNTLVDGVDGIAGKIRYEYDRFGFDRIDYIYVNGRDILVNSAPICTYGCDEWGYDIKSLNLNSYRMSKKYAV